jgi:hypothetical protein
MAIDYRSKFNSISRSWLGRTSRGVKDSAQSFIGGLGSKLGFSLKRSGKRSAKVTGSRVQGTKATISGKESFSKPGFNKKVNVPIGGFKPKTAKAFPMEKPEGLIFRSRTYTKHQGKTIEFPGFFTHGAKVQFSGRRGKRTMNALAEPVAILVGLHIAVLIVEAFRARGIPAYLQGGIKGISVSSLEHFSSVDLNPGGSVISSQTFNVA